MIKAAQAGVHNSALYEAGEWWPGLSQITTKRNKKASTRFCWHMDHLHSINLLTILVALPIRRTTLNKTLKRKLGTPIAAIILQQRKLLAAIYIQPLDAWNLLAFRSRKGPKEITSCLAP
ncbi:hypothetical protein K3495_g3329 [Podosphaera aphanis]|nr:hypothetical protein K3495_g3329 [Podosphaera aphanis]